MWSLLRYNLTRIQSPHVCGNEKQQQNWHNEREHLWQVTDFLRILTALLCAAGKTCKAVTLTLLHERHRDALSQRTVTEHNVNHWTAKQQENRVPWKQKTIDRYWSHIYVTKKRLSVYSFKLVKSLNHENSRHDSPVSLYVFHIKTKYIRM